MPVARSTSEATVLFQLQHGHSDDEGEPPAAKPAVSSKKEHPEAIHSTEPHVQPELTYQRSYDVDNY
jgi:hypothetical protein